MLQIQLHDILWRLPAGERQDAMDRINFAEKMGWEKISLWSWLPRYRYSLDDLVGVSPKGEFDFLPAVPDRRQPA